MLNSGYWSLVLVTCHAAVQGSKFKVLFALNIEQYRQATAGEKSFQLQDSSLLTSLESGMTLVTSRFGRRI
jgi:hypothetical protein